MTFRGMDSVSGRDALRKDSAILEVE
jgi:hypothetical protein